MIEAESSSEKVKDGKGRQGSHSSETDEKTVKTVNEMC